MKRLIKVMSMLLVLSLASIAIMAIATPTGPQELIESVANQTLERIKKDKDKIKADPKFVNGLIEELVLPNFDFERMSRWVLGKHWRKANDSQKQQFIEEFKNLLIRTYATSLLEYSNQEIRYLPFRAAAGAEEVTVRSEIDQPGGFAIPIDYQLYQKGAEWKVFDVIIDDVSLVTNYRSSFSREIRQSGLDNLIKSLAEKN